MSTVTVTPSANSAVNSSGWPDNGPADYTKINTSDGDTTYIYTPTANSLVTYPTSSAGLSGTETINSVTVHTLIKSLDPVSSTTAAVVYTHSTSYAGSSNDTVTNNTSYIDFSNTWTTNPNTGAAWTVAEVNAMEIGVKKINSAGQRCTYIYAVVDYTSGGVANKGSFFSFM